MKKRQQEELQCMLDDMDKQEELYRPTSFWQEASKLIIEDINNNGITNFRSLVSAYSMFAPIYSYFEYVKDKTLFTKTKNELLKVTSDIKSNIKLELLISGQIQAWSDYRVLQASNRDYAPYTNKVTESNLGNPIEHYNFDDVTFHAHF